MKVRWQTVNGTSIPFYPEGADEIRCQCHKIAGQNGWSGADWLLTQMSHGSSGVDFAAIIWWIRHLCVRARGCQPFFPMGKA
ncbi:MAG: hypothetical protein M2R45_03655 [Verrucomicrobia subdivision 3 bacterium]|nr:hypothetical protein [Limisphaerales bacterium]MCS1412716.1 hypothetical protein [Limisphaerales bacterium]